MEQISRKTSHFEEIEFTKGMYAEITFCDEEEIIINAPSEYQPYIHVFVENNVLKFAIDDEICNKTAKVNAKRCGCGTNDIEKLKVTDDSWFAHVKVNKATVVTVYDTSKVKFINNTVVLPELKICLSRKAELVANNLEIDKLNVCVAKESKFIAKDINTKWHHEKYDFDICMCDNSKMTINNVVAFDMDGKLDKNCELKINNIKADAIELDLDEQSIFTANILEAAPTVKLQSNCRFDVKNILAEPEDIDIQYVLRTVESVAKKLGYTEKDYNKEEIEKAIKAEKYDIETISDKELVKLIELARNI